MKAFEHTTCGINTESDKGTRGLQFIVTPLIALAVTHVTSLFQRFKTTSIHPIHFLIPFLILPMWWRAGGGLFVWFSFSWRSPLYSHLPHQADCNRPWSLDSHKPDSLKGNLSYCYWLQGLNTQKPLRFGAANDNAIMELLYQQNSCSEDVSIPWVKSVPISPRGTCKIINARKSIFYFSLQYRNELKWNDIQKFLTLFFTRMSSYFWNSTLFTQPNDICIADRQWLRLLYK